MKTVFAGRCHAWPQLLPWTLAVLAPLASMLLVPRAGSAAVQECQVRVLQPITDDMRQTWAAGSLVPVDIARSDPDGGQFCAHGGSCLPRRAAGGQAALLLLNCRIGKAIGGGDYRLVPDAHLAGSAAAAAMRARAKAERKLSNMGFSNAAAGSLAEQYVTHPHSDDGLLVARALAGSARARTTLQQRFP